MVWFVANTFSCQTAGNGLGASFAVLTRTIAPWIALDCELQGLAPCKSHFTPVHGVPGFLLSMRKNSRAP